MLEVDGVVALVLLGLWIYCIFDVVTTDESFCRNLPKMVWLFIVFFVPDIGSIIWLVAGGRRRRRSESATLGIAPNDARSALRTARGSASTSTSSARS